MPQFTYLHRRTGLTERGAVVVWVCEHDDMYSAEIEAGPCHTVHLQVEDLGDTGWDWHVWDRAAHVQQRYGLADTASQAQAQAEAAFGLIAVELRHRSTL
ncbi:MAG: hypothetical protein ACRYGM_14635 [Janthinobacterium lividum]